MLIIPSITNSINTLIKTLPTNSRRFVNYLGTIPYINNLIDLNNLDTIFNTIESLILNYSSNILQYSDTIILSVSSFISTLTLIIMSLLMAFYALKDTNDIWRNIEDFIVVFFPKNVSYKIIRVSKLTDRSLKKFLVGKLYTCIILGALTSFGIVVFNIISPFTIPYAPLMGVIIGLTNIIPYVGPIIGTVPCIMLALFSGFWEAVGILTIILIMQQIDNIIVSPKILGETVGLKPFWVILSVTVGGTLFGALGMVLSVPITSVILHLIDEKMENYYASKKKEKKENTKVTS
jgi:predicted PurR-regulated permease PerM